MLAGLGAAQGNAKAQSALNQLKATFQANHGGMNVRQVLAARRLGTTTGGPPSITGG